MIQNEHMDSWTKKSWMDDLAKDARFAKDLTSIYADDVIQAVEDKEFNSLDDAISALKVEVGLTTADVADIKKIVVAKTEPAVFIAQQNISKLSKKDLGELLKLATTPCEKCSNAPCDCSHSISSVAARAIANIGLEALAESYDCMKEDIDTKAETDKKEEEEKTAEAAVELTKEATKLQELMAGGSSANEALEVVAKGMNPGFQAYLDKKKKEKEGKSEKPSDETAKTDDKKDEKEASLKSKVERWAEFLGKKGYFQGANEPTVEGDKVTSNNPEKLGYGTKDGIEYDRKAMETTAPGGEDSRPYEDKAFNESATRSEKAFLPGGTDLELKKKWQRARYMGAVKRARELKKKLNQ